MSEWELAWKWRNERGLFEETQALRVFHGPGEGTGQRSRIAIDRFGENYWITAWEKGAASVEEAIREAAHFLGTKGAHSVVFLPRPEKGVPGDPIVLSGKAPEGRFTVREGRARFGIQFLGVKHPGLFLDHAPLRNWLGVRAKGWRVLNTFAYTGSLSVAAGLGGAAKVTTLDLSKPIVQWATDNWKLNGLEEARGDFIFGDVFEWLPRMARREDRFDCVILDPPSFSHGKKGDFSTDKDLMKLHALALSVLAPGGVLITSINSASVPRAKFEADIEASARQGRRRFQILHSIELPETFPTRMGQSQDRYLKGWILRAVEDA